MDMFKMIKEAAAMKSKLAEMERVLKEKVIEIEESGIKVKINAKSEVLDIKISQEVLKQSAEKIEKDLLRVLQNAAKEAHGLMMQEAKAITGGMKIPGLM
jgi:DNA-binding protein YbaB